VAIMDIFQIDGPVEASGVDVSVANTFDIDFGGVTFDQQVCMKVGYGDSSCSRTNTDSSVSRDVNLVIYLALIGVGFLQEMGPQFESISALCSIHFDLIGMQSSGDVNLRAVGGFNGDRSELVKNVYVGMRTKGVMKLFFGFGARH